MKKHRLNILPEMKEEAYVSLKNDIEKNGFDNKFPIYIYEDEIIDGWNRFKACKELKVTPIYKHFTGSSLEALTFILRTNNRRDLSSSQRACLAADSDEIIETLTKEIEEERRKKISEARQNEMREKIPSSKRDESKVTTKLAQTFGTNSRYVSDAQRFKKEKPEVFEQIKNGTINISEAKKEEKKEEKEKKIQEIKESAKEFENTDIKIYNKDFRELKIEDSSIDLILTDPPYPAEYLHLWKDLFIQAKRVLKPNKFIVAYSGQMYLDKIFKYANEAGLDYYWMINIEFTKKPLVHGRKVLNEWKPILVFQNGLKQHDRVFSDKITMKYTEREMHDLNWGQTIEPFEFLLDRFSNTQDLIYEPFAGTGTTLIACKNKNRKCIGTEVKTDYIDLIKGRLK
jgi:site-specific DNA-adenine methylase